MVTRMQYNRIWMSILHTIKEIHFDTTIILVIDMNRHSRFCIKAPQYPRRKKPGADYCSKQHTVLLRRSNTVRLLPTIRLLFPVGHHIVSVATVYACTMLTTLTTRYQQEDTTSVWHYCRVFSTFNGCPFVSNRTDNFNNKVLHISI